MTERIIPGATQEPQNATTAIGEPLEGRTAIRPELLDRILRYMERNGVDFYTAYSDICREDAQEDREERSWSR